MHANYHFMRLCKFEFQVFKSPAGVGDPEYFIPAYQYVCTADWLGAITLTFQYWKHVKILFNPNNAIRNA